MPRQNSIALRLVLLAALLLAGCGPKAEIRVYKVPKDSGGPQLAMPGSSAPAKETQILGAILPNRNAAWFFKLTGDPEVVAEHSEEFRKIVDSVQFGPTGDPTWQLAEGWTQQLAQGMSYAKLNKPSAGLTATVTQLFNVEGDVPWSEDSWRTYVTENVNRWRNQLDLAKQGWETLEPGLEEVAELSQGPAKAYFVSLVGKGSGGMRGPFQTQGTSSLSPEAAQASSEAADQPAAAAESKPETAATQAAKPRVRGTAPADWQPLDVAGSSMRLMAFAIKDDSAAAPAELTVIEAGGDIAANMSMWMNQVALAPTPELVNEVVRQVEQVPVQDVTASVYFLDGSQAEAGQAILVADVPWRSQTSLFVKLKGDAPTVAAQRDKFLAFVRSLAWDNGTDSESAEPSSDPATGEPAAQESPVDADAVAPASEEQDPAASPSEQSSPDKE